VLSVLSVLSMLSVLSVLSVSSALSSLMDNMHHKSYSHFPPHEVSPIPTFHHMKLVLFPVSTT
jgi:hypothetical protein